MKKTFNILNIIMILILLISCNGPNNLTPPNGNDNGNGNGNENGDGPKPDPDPEYSYDEILADRFFETGFYLLGQSPVDDGRQVKKILDYGDTAKPSTKPIWFMAQWWTPYNFVDATYGYIDGAHTYLNQSRMLEVKTGEEGYLTMELLGSEEYLGGTREPSESWAHFLLEQYFDNDIDLSEIDKLIVSLDFKINKLIDKNGKDYNANYHAAQLLWYFTVRNYVDEGSSFEEVGKPNDYMWFGVPILDSRYDFVPNSAHIDTGSAGTTNKLIYSMPSKDYISEKIQVGKDYHIEIDILPYIKEAYLYARENDALVNSLFENLRVDYMNFGWELPGAFDVSATIKNMSVQAVTLINK